MDYLVNIYFLRRILVFLQAEKWILGKILKFWLYVSVPT